MSWAPVGDNGGRAPITSRVSDMFTPTPAQWKVFSMDRKAFEGGVQKV